MTNYKLALTTCPAEKAHNLARIITESKNVACVNIIENVYSIFHWKGNLETERESILLMKTTSKQIESLKKLIQEEHPYDVPEFIVTGIESGARSYLDWISEVVE